MILTLTSDKFTLDSGFYYSQPFKIETTDNYIAVEAELLANGTASMQHSIDGITWFDAANTSFSCATKGLQGYADCIPQLNFRLKSSTQFVYAKILL